MATAQSLSGRMTEASFSDPPAWHEGRRIGSSEHGAPQSRPVTRAGLTQQQLERLQEEPKKETPLSTIPQHSAPGTI